MPQGPLGGPRPFIQEDYRVVFPNATIHERSGKITGVSHMHVERVEQTPEGDIEVVIEPSTDGSLLLVAVESVIDVVEERYGKKLNLSEAKIYC